MPHGAPDFSNRQALSTIFAIFDLGEAVARLGSIVYFDRRGNVLLLEDFEAGLGRWGRVAGGGGVTPALSFTAVRSGQFSALLQTGAGAGSWSDMTLSVAYRTVGGLGVEFSFVSAASYALITLWFGLRTGTTLYRAGIRYNSVLDRLEYLDSANTWQVLDSGIKLDVGSMDIHTLKLVVDFSLATYKRVLLNALTYQMSTLALYSVSDIGAPRLDVEMRATAGIAQVERVYIDDVIITQNEP